MKKQRYTFNTLDENDIDNLISLTPDHVIFEDSDYFNCVRLFYTLKKNQFQTNIFEVSIQLEPYKEKAEEVKDLYVYFCNCEILERKVLYRKNNRLSRTLEKRVSKYS